jgi:hypothetical protein
MRQTNARLEPGIQRLIDQSDNIAYRIGNLYRRISDSELHIAAVIQESDTVIQQSQEIIDRFYRLRKEIHDAG